MTSFNNKTTDLHTSCTYYGKINYQCRTPYVAEFPPNYYSVVKAGDILERIENAFQNANNNNKRVDSNDGTLLTKEEFLKKYGESKWHTSISKDYKKKEAEKERDRFYNRLRELLEKLHNFKKDDLIVPILINCGHNIFYFPEDYKYEFNKRSKSEQLDDDIHVDDLRCHPIFIEIYLDIIKDYSIDGVTIEPLSFDAFEANAWTLNEDEGFEDILIDNVTIKSFKEKKELFDVLQRIKNVVFDPEDGCNSQKIHCLKEILKGVEM